MVYHNKLIDNIQVTILEERVLHPSSRRLEVWFEDEDNIAWTYLENVIKKPSKVISALKLHGFIINNQNFIDKLLDFVNSIQIQVKV